MANYKFYAVKKGIEPGIYERWIDCEAQIKGFTSPVFKGFNSKEEAQKWLNQDTTFKKQNKKEYSNVSQNLEVYSKRMATFLETLGIYPTKVIETNKWGNKTWVYKRTDTVEELISIYKLYWERQMKK